MTHQILGRILARLLSLAAEVWRGKKRKVPILVFAVYLWLCCCCSAVAANQFCSPTQPLSSPHVSAFLERHRAVTEGCAAAERAADGGAAVVVVRVEDATENNALLTIAGTQIMPNA